MFADSIRFTELTMLLTKFQAFKEGIQYMYHKS